MSRLMTKWHVRPAKTLISLGIHPVWSETSLSAWRKLGSSVTHWAHSKDSDQTGWMPRLIWVFAGRTVILLVLSWGGSNLKHTKVKTARAIVFINNVWVFVGFEIKHKPTVKLSFETYRYELTVQTQIRKEQPPRGYTVCEPWHEKTNKMTVHPAKTQISLGIRPVWSESLLSAWWKLWPLATHRAHSEDSDQIGRMPRLFSVFAGSTAILLVLSCCGSCHSFYCFWTLCCMVEPPCCEKTCLMPYANNKGADQPMHPHSLISAFVVCCLDSIIPIFAKSKIIVYAAEQAGLSIT